MTTLDLEKARVVAIEAAEAAGAELRRRGGLPAESYAKGDDDVVTDLDYAAEEIIIDRLRADFPDHHIVSEEAGAVTPAGEWSWLVDPLDGTNNVAIGLPVYSVGLALCDDGVPMVGVVHEPLSARTWSAVRGRGAWLGRDRRLQRRPRTTGRRPLLAWTQGYAVGRDDRAAVTLRLLVDRESRRLLQLWSPLLCWVMLARGDIDGIVGYQIGQLDLHAGMLIATEAGAEVRTLSGTPFDDRLGDVEETRSLIAGWPGIPDRLLVVRAAAETARDRLTGLWAAAETVLSRNRPADQ